MPNRLLIASLGNPAPYTNTFHSAGHVLINALREYLSYPPFSRDRNLGNGFASIGNDFTLWQSPSLMNISGKSVATAYKGFLRDLPADERLTAKLIVIHDELDSPLGKIKLKIGGSARGHNGIKSCIASLGGIEFVKFGVGIGRPESRESKDVANYVLRKMTQSEVMKIRDGAGEVFGMLEKIRDR